ncbi:MAG: glycosyltransferase family 9 protein [Candidatus Marinimicrobia bacterium]|nr:glycosyltransferase family 9 protein [Candidatus Neomarinimicrobiota bacterium]
MSIKEQQILNPRKLRVARFFSRLSGNIKPALNANASILKSGIRKILIQEHQCIGDVLMLEPSLTAIKKAYPDAEVHLLCVPAMKELAIKTKLADKILQYPKEAPLAEDYDLAFDFHGDVRRLKSLKKYSSRLYAGFSFSGGAKLLSHVIDYPYDEHQVERPFDLLEKLNIPVERKIPELKGFENISKIRDMILLHPGADHDARRWPEEHWQELIAKLKRDEHDMIWITPPSESFPKDVKSFTGDLVELAELIAGATLLIGCDSMSVHLAAALGTPALAIFGSQDPELTKPYGPKGYFIIPEKECTHRRRDWRLCKECMKAVEPEDVFQQINSIISK